MGLFDTILYNKTTQKQVEFKFVDVDVPCRASYGMNIARLIRFARVCSHVADFKQDQTTN